jgi:VanZ family protein
MTFVRSHDDAGTAGVRRRDKGLSWRKAVKTNMRIFAWATVLAIAVLSLIPGDRRPHTFAPGQAEHVAAYLVAAAAFTLSYWGNVRPAVIALGLTVYGAALELGQHWAPGRHPQLEDVAADALGAIAGILCAVLIQRMLQPARWWGGGA